MTIKQLANPGSGRELRPATAPVVSYQLSLDLTPDVGLNVPRDTCGDGPVPSGSAAPSLHPRGAEADVTAHHEKREFKIALPATPNRMVSSRPPA